MENRYENLYGYVQRSLVKNIRKEFGNDESITIGFLVYTPYSESFYYESTVKNTLVFPEEIKKHFHEIQIWNMELMFYLGRYFSMEKTKRYILDLINDNSKLAPNASYFSIAFDEYERFKLEWLQWLSDLQPSLFTAKYNSEDIRLKNILNQLFHFANYLLTIIGYNAYREWFTPTSGSFREHIYRVIIDKVINNNTGGVEPTTGELRPNKAGYTWHRQTDTDPLLKYSDLAMALEICFKQPFSVKDKIQDIKAITDDSETEGKKFQLAAMAKPLHYNGEFQGVIYITRSMEKGNFSDSDFEKFKQVIAGFHIESLLHTSRFDTARILVEKISSADFRVQIHPLVKVLNAQHIFSSSPLGLVIIPDLSSYVRYRDNKVMQTKKSSITSEDLFDFFKKIIGLDLPEVMKETNYLWHEIPENLESTFNKELYSKLEITEDLFIKSFVCMKFQENNKDNIYVIFNFNHIEYLSQESSHAIKQSYALRTRSNINNLIDAYLYQKKLSDIQNNLLNEVQLGFIHQEKSFLKESVIKKLDEIDFLKPSLKVRALTKQIRIDTNNAIERFSVFLKVLAEQSNELNKSFIGLSELENEILEIKKSNKFKGVKIISDLSQLTPADKVESYLNTISFCLNELVANAVKQYNSSEGQAILNKEIRINIWPTMANEDKRSGLVFEVFNTGTTIPDSIRDIAGLERVANGSNGSSGLGFMLMNKTLKRILAAQIDSEQYFTITTLPLGTAIKFTIYNKLARK